MAACKRRRGGAAVRQWRPRLSLPAPPQQAAGRQQTEGALTHEATRAQRGDASEVDRQPHSGKDQQGGGGGGGGRADS